MHSRKHFSTNAPWGSSSTFKERFLVRRYLAADLFMAPTKENQILWARCLDGERALNFDDGTWTILQKFTLPRIRLFGSHAHNSGIERLGLNRAGQPEFDPFVKTVLRESGWSVFSCAQEMEPLAFFSCLSQRRFPTVPALRPLHEVFCGSKPDFWHEGVGHLSLLTDPSYSDFYQKCGELVTGLSDQGNEKLSLQLANILWVLLEYGFVSEGQNLKSFGAALTGSLMGLERFRRGYLSFEPFDCGRILKSRFYEDGRKPRRTWNRHLKFFYCPSLKFAQDNIERWVDKNSFP